MMNPTVKELIVLQVIYALIVPQVQDVDIKDSNNMVSGNNDGSMNSGDNNDTDNDNGGMNDKSRQSTTYSGLTDSSSYLYNSVIENKVISSNIKLSLVKITNEIQNSLLVNKLMDMNNEPKLTIKDILSIIRGLFPLQRTILIDGQLSFHNLKIKDLKNLITIKYTEYKRDQIRIINEYADQVISIVSSNMENNTGNSGNTYMTGKENIPQSVPTIHTDTTESSPSKMTSVVSSKTKTPHGLTSTVVNDSSSKPTHPSLAASSTTTGSNTTNVRNTVTTTTANGTVMNKDPKREKLLQLYRDTVLNKLQSKTKILDRLYKNLDPEQSRRIVHDLLELERIKSTTPTSVHHLQLILQKSVSDGIMSSRTGSLTWQIARQVQTELDDTVHFMRRALE